MFLHLSSSMMILLSPSLCLTCIMEAFSAELVRLCIVFVCVAMAIRLRARVEVSLASCSAVMIDLVETLESSLVQVALIVMLGFGKKRNYSPFNLLPTRVGWIGAFLLLFMAS